MKTSSNTPPRLIATCLVQFDAALVRQCYRKTKISPFVLAFHSLKFLSPSGNATLKQFTLENKIFI
jgi:hypothetical protein